MNIANSPITSQGMIISGQQPHYLTIYSDGVNALVSINLTSGLVTFGKDYTPCRTAKLFWQAMACYCPTVELQNQISELQDKLNQKTKE